MILHAFLWLALHPAFADPGLEAAKQESGVAFAEGLAAPGAPSVLAGPALAGGGPRGVIASFGRSPERGAPPPPPSPSPRRDSFGSRRMVALTMTGYALGTAAMAYMFFASPFLFLAMLPVGAAYEACKKRREGGTRREIAAAAAKGGFLGLTDGPALLGAWLGIRANALLDHVSFRARNTDERPPRRP